MILTDLVIRQDLNPRSQLNPETVERYAAILERVKNKEIENPFPPITVQHDTNILVDGYHRATAAIGVGLEQFPHESVIIDDDQLFLAACQANTRHGLQLTIQERDAAIWRLYKEGQTNGKLSDMFGLAPSMITFIVGAKARTEKVSLTVKIVEREITPRFEQTIRQVPKPHQDLFAQVIATRKGDINTNEVLGWRNAIKGSKTADKALAWMLENPHATNAPQEWWTPPDQKAQADLREKILQLTQNAKETETLESLNDIRQLLTVVFKEASALPNYSDAYAPILSSAWEAIAKSEQRLKDVGDEMVGTHEEGQAKTDSFLAELDGCQNALARANTGIEIDLQKTALVRIEEQIKALPGIAIPRVLHERLTEIRERSIPWAVKRVNKVKEAFEEKALEIAKREKQKEAAETPLEAEVKRCDDLVPVNQKWRRFLAAFAEITKLDTTQLAQVIAKQDYGFVKLDNTIFLLTALQKAVTEINEG